MRRARGRPLRAAFDPEFGSIEARLDALALADDVAAAQLAELSVRLGPLLPREAGLPGQAELLARVHLERHNAGMAPPTFPGLRSQAVSAAQFRAPEFRRWRDLVNAAAFEGDWVDRVFARGYLDRKAWEWVFVLQAAREAGLLREGVRACGFGVGLEPVPALLARHGVEVLATDQPAEHAGAWAETSQHSGAVEALLRPIVVGDDVMRRLVTFRPVDMNALPGDLGAFDLVWSSCTIEHLGTPAAGMDFVVESCRMLRPGGLAVHTTELELTARSETADWGQCAVYRVDDLRALERRLTAIGCAVDLDTYVAMEAPEDRWISRVPLGAPPAENRANLKLAIGESVSTSFGILVRAAGVR